MTQEAWLKYLLKYAEAAYRNAKQAKNKPLTKQHKKTVEHRRAQLSMYRTKRKLEQEVS